MKYRAMMANDVAMTLHRITGEPPIAIRRGDRTVWLTRRQYALAAAVLYPTGFHQREMAARLGYSLSGLREALAQLTRLGVLTYETTRGRFGRTVARLTGGWVVSKVRTVVQRFVRAPTYEGGDQDRDLTVRTYPEGGHAGTTYEVRPTGAGGASRDVRPAVPGGARAQT